MRCQRCGNNEGRERLLLTKIDARYCYYHGKGTYCDQCVSDINRDRREKKQDKPRE